VPQPSTVTTLTHYFRTFYLLVVDELGQPREAIGVKIYNKFEGGVYDDDWVEIEQPRRRKPGQWPEVNKLTNLSSGALFRGRRFRFLRDQVCAKLRILRSAQGRGDGHANPSHLNVLKYDVKIWNLWRDQHPSVRSGFTRANLRGSNHSDIEVCRSLHEEIGASTSRHSGACNVSLTMGTKENCQKPLTTV
jgi:hypothetical protein